MDQFVATAQQVLAQIPAAELVLFTGVLTAGVHGLIKKHKELSKAVNIFISLILPLVGAVLGALMASASVLAAYPKIYATAQISYYIYNGVKATVDWLQLGKAVRSVNDEVTSKEIRQFNETYPEQTTTAQPIAANPSAFADPGGTSYPTPSVITPTAPDDF